jgi:hypothetical protein
MTRWIQTMAICRRPRASSLARSIKGAVGGCLPGSFVFPAVAVFGFSFIAGGCLEILCFELAPVFCRRNRKLKAVSA